MKKSRYLVWLGSIILAATATLHSTGYAEVSTAVAASDLEGTLSTAIGGLWLFASVHWLFLAALALVSIRLAGSAASWVLGLTASVLVVDIVMLLIHVGPFLGEVLLGISVIAYAAAALLIGADEPPEG